MIEADKGEAIVNLRFDGSPFDLSMLITARNDCPTTGAECSLHLGLNHYRFRIVNQ
jgi:hypothetical protein